MRTCKKGKYLDVLLTALVIAVLLISAVLLNSMSSFAEDKRSSSPRVNSKMGYYERNLYCIDWMVLLLDEEDYLLFLNPCFVKSDNEGEE